MRLRTFLFGLMSMSVFCVVCCWAQTPNAETINRMESILAAADRPAKQRERDAARKPEIAFVLPYIKEGDRVLDLGATAGYMSMILSGAVGAKGHVDAQNPADWVEHFKLGDALNALTQLRPNISLLTVDFEAVAKPSPPYDAIFAGLMYHDTFNNPNHDEAKMDKALWAALRPGGYLIMTDHQAQAGSGARDTKTLHRIDKQKVMSDLIQAGFKLVLDSPVLNSQDDDESLAIFNPKVRGHTNRLALVFQK